MADKSFGVDQLDILGTGTPTISAPNQLNLDCNTVAISTSCTIGNNLTVTSTTNSANLNVTGIGTLTRGFATDLSVSGISTISQPSNANPHSLWDVVNNSSSAYRFTGPGQDGAEDNPNIYLVRGQRYIFKVNASGHPFQLRVANGGAAYSDGVTNNGAQSGNVVINVQHDAPAQLYYQCTSHGGMVGNIYVVGGPQVISGVVTATTFVGNLTGNVTGTLQTAAQPNITSVGTLSALTVSGNINVSSTDPTIVFVDSDNNPDFDIKAGGGRFAIRDSTNNAERLRIASNGSVSINYAGTGDNTLHIGNTSNAGGIIIKSPGDHYSNMVVDSNRSGANNGIFNLAGKWNGNDVAYISFTTGSDTTNKDDGYIKMYTRESGQSLSERLRIDSSGFVSIGRAASALAYGSTNTMLEVKASDASNSIFETATFRGGADNNGAGARVRIVQGTHRGLVLEGGRTSNAGFGAIKISDQNGGLTSSVHIDSSGTWFWGKTSQSSGTAGVELYKDGPNFMTRNGTTVLGLNCQNGTNGDIMRFYFQDVHKGSLNFSSGSFSATTASDYRLKENDTPITDGIARVKKLKPIRFNFKENPSETLDGFFAHELQEVVPDCVTGEKDGEISERGEGYQCISKEGLVPLLTAALQEAIAEIETLKTKVAALEGS